jgi:two-component system, chemotaxis family, chemotaxis protein CheY
MLQVLIIEDNQVIRMTLRAMLRQAGYQVAGEARDGESGMQMVRQLRPDVVCLDIQLPGIDGVQVLRQLRDEFPALAVVIVSGYTDRDTVGRVVAAGADAVVVKPFSEARLVAAIDKASAARAAACAQAPDSPCSAAGAEEGP